jgi:hypothetical protein
MGTYSMPRIAIGTACGVIVMLVFAFGQAWAQRPAAWDTRVRSQALPSAPSRATPAAPDTALDIKSPPQPKDKTRKAGDVAKRHPGAKSD